MIRLAGPEDSQQLAYIAQAAYGKYTEMLTEPPAPILLDYEAVASSGHTYVLAEAGELQGMVTIERDDPHLILRNLAVHPSCQGKGIGRRLVRLVEDIARADRLSGIRLWTRAEMHDNIAFYKRLDYVITHVEETATTNRVFFYKEIFQTGVHGSEP
jgi:ribosomal protein S18 acetylase RimI-like enzyme